MSWLPAFQIGILNAWMLMLFFVIHPLLLVLVDKAVGTGGINQKLGEMPTDERGKRNNTLATGILFLLSAYSIFLPLRVGTTWLYAGLAIYLLGVGMLVTTMVNIAAAPTGAVFSRGMYRFSRHPAYLSMAVILAGVSAAAASWVFLLGSILYTLPLISEALREEQACHKMYGEEYAEYMHRTPRWIGFPGPR